MKIEDKIRLSWQAFSMENSLLQSYRAQFMMVQAALLALGFVLLRVDLGLGVLFPAVVGWIVAVIWVIVCEAKKRDVDTWRDRIVSLQSATRTDWFEYLKSQVEPSKRASGSRLFNYIRTKLSGGVFARYLFNYIMPLVITALWVFMVIGGK